MADTNPLPGRMRSSGEDRSTRPSATSYRPSTSVSKTAESTGGGAAGSRTAARQIVFEPPFLRWLSPVIDRTTNPAITQVRRIRTVDLTIVTFRVVASQQTIDDDDISILCCPAWPQFRLYEDRMAIYIAPPARTTDIILAVRNLSTIRAPARLTRMRREAREQPQPSSTVRGMSFTASS